MRKSIVISIIIVSLFVIVPFLFYNGIIWFVYPEYMGYPVKGIDVARYQGNIDWKEIHNQNIKFAFIKATEGSSYIDPMLDQNISSSLNNEIYAGVYHFFSTESSGKTQADNFFNAVSRYQLTLPPVMDYEIPIENINKDKIIEEAKIFLQETERNFLIRPIIYTTYETYNVYWTNYFDEYLIWFRDLFKEPNIREDSKLIFWQYCNRGRLNGIDKKQKYVDLNVFCGDIEKFNNYVSNISQEKAKK